MFTGIRKSIKRDGLDKALDSVLGPKKRHYRFSWRHFGEIVGLATKRGHRGKCKHRIRKASGKKR